MVIGISGVGAESSGGEIRVSSPARGTSKAAVEAVGYQTLYSIFLAV